ncbi:YeeE/YedE thiosulfate transporter family protein [Nitrosospira sp. Nsp13]|uniref:YeeE/YedE thiosulfate transporter family protein n=1 Tax=Nitrosospira sp. Nsp13 TaxID=1855332 RepID=UPI00088932B5|nr:YeeE/YedE thiosulfate transporter family protein [Nitrosospira sp. Nsp13]SCX80386.1 hypothetical protein SAMN05216308_101329 [Nitrosospira sp. Nsp13]
MEHDGGAWSPYLVGTLIGVLSMATFYFSNQPIGASTSFARIAGLIGNLFSKGHTESLKFFQETKPQIEWGVMLMAGIILGAFLAAYTGGEITAQWIPTLWEEHFGSSRALRLGVAFIGGTVMAFGARLAGGCTSGHGISGALQLSVGSWIALMCFFAGGVVTAKLMFSI